MPMSSSQMEVQIIVGVPPANLDALLQSMGQAGAGELGAYTYCSFSVTGTGRFFANEGALPYLGAVGTLNQETEVRVETFCTRARARAIVDAIRKAHPYETPVIYLIPLLNPDEL